MVRVPHKMSTTDRKTDPLTSQQRNPSTTVGNAYLNHLQSKKNNSGIDPRQTIASPVLRSKVPLEQQTQQRYPSDTSSSFVALPNDVQPNRNKSNLAKTLPRSANVSLTVTPQGGKQRRSRRGRKSEGAKPPLGFQQKHSRSTLSEATNSTYLSSDSDEDASTATATVHSDGTSSFQSSHSNSVGVRHRARKSRSDRSSSPRSGTSPSNYPERHYHQTCNSDAMVPYQPNETHGTSYSYDDSRYGENGGIHYFNEQHRSTRYEKYENDINNSINNHDDAEEFSYSDEDDYYYRQQQGQPSEHDFFRQINNNCNDEDNDALAVDLDKLIEEASARWKLTVSETVQSTVTSASFASSSAFVSPLLQREYSNAEAVQRVAVPPPVLKMSEHQSSFINQNLPANVVSTSSSTSQLIQEQRSEIEALRAELQKHQQQASQPTIAVSNQNGKELCLTQDSQIPPPSVHPIQVLTVATDHHNAVDDDLTVWSGFHSMSAPPPLQQHRPDADSSSGIVDNCASQHPMQNSKGNRVPQPPRPPVQRTSPQTIQLELSSIVTGITRSAIFTGTVLSTALPTTDSFTTLTNISITGTGVLQFLETGDVYRGDIVHSEMHGYGTYTFGTKNIDKQDNVLRGRFEHNVFIGG